MELFLAQLICFTHQFWLILIFEAIKLLLYIKFMYARVLQTENANTVSVNIIPHNISVLFWPHSK